MRCLRRRSRPSNPRHRAQRRPLMPIDRASTGSSPPRRSAQMGPGAAMIPATDDLWRGVRPSIGDVLDRAAGRAVALILSTFVVALIVGGLAVTVAIAGVILGV